MCKDIPALHPISGRRQPVIALIGCDGSGKSTVGTVLLEEMRKDRPTALCHLGKQAGNLERILRPVPYIGSLVSHRADKENKRTQSGKKATLPAILIGFILSMRRVVRFCKMRVYHRRGFAILTDRYPQNHVPGPMDGPTLANLNMTGQFVHCLSRLERHLYAHMARFRPDVVIRLNVDIETALQRKPDHVRFKLERKISDLSKLHFNGAPIVDIDSTIPLEDVLKHAKAVVRAVGQLYPPKARAGALISLVGCDGSGKSSLSHDLVKTLSSQRPTLYGYLGLGTGDMGRRIATWPVIGRFLEKKLVHKAKKTRTKGEKIPGFVTALVVFTLSLLRLVRFRRVQKAVEKGYLVITDRYPQAEIAGQCDGPGLSAARTRNPLIRFLAWWEKRLYQKMAAYHPDVVVFLDVDIETSLQRKPDHDRETLEPKFEVMPRLTFDGAPKVTLNARQDYSTVRQEIMDTLRKHRII